MKDKPGFFRLYGKSPLYQLLMSIMIIGGGGLSLMLLLVLVGLQVFGSDLTVLDKAAASLSTRDIAFLRYLIIIQDLSLLFIPSIIILRLLKPDDNAGLTELKLPGWKEGGLVIILTFCIFPVTNFTGQINSAMHLPGWLSGVEQWMTDKEDQADNLIDTLVSSNTFGTMLTNLLIIALIPAVAEEFIFRGVFQKILASLFRSGHLAIWVTAFIFSAIHFQFFGFIPRFILGLVFGYLFFWSGTLWLPVISHFINNAFPVILTYLQGGQKIGVPVETPLWKQAIYLPIPVVIILLIFFYFRNKSINPLNRE